MQVEQAIFTSADNAAMRGYQLVSRSPGIDRRLAQELCRWAPSHASLWGEASNGWSLNYFPAGDDWIVITRTLYGGAEYSLRGGRQVVTMMLAMRVDQFAGYQSDPLAVAKTALALGHLRLQTDAPERLPTLTMPRQSFSLANTPSATPARVTGGAGGSLAGMQNGLDGRRPERPGSHLASPHWPEVVDLLCGGERVAVAGVREPRKAVEDLMQWIPAAERLSLSFTTGLKPSIRRPFRLQFLPTTDPALRRTLTSQGIRCVPSIG